MKKVFIGISLLAVTCMLGTPAFAALHEPVAVGGCPGTIPAAFDWAELPVFAQGGTAVADAPVTAWPTVYDFCGMLDQSACSVAAVAGLGIDLGDMAELPTLLQCLNADINGTLDMAATIPVKPNGIPDGQYELGVVGEALNNAANPYHAAALAAFQLNFQNLKNLIATALIGEGYWGYVGLMPDLIGSLGGVLSGYAILGDPTTDAALNAILSLLSGIGVTPPAGGITDITDNVPALGPAGDADGDGFTNRAEYNYFSKQPNATPATVIAATFDAAQTPPPTVARVLVAGGGTYEFGSSLELRATAVNCTAATYEWSKDGAPIATATASSFIIPVLADTDSGNYVCTITTADKGAKEVVESKPVTVTVLAQGVSLPLASGLSLALLAGACALGGAGSIRRRK